GVGGPVEDPAAGELVEPGRVQGVVADPGGQDHGVGGDLAAVGEGHHQGRPSRLEAGDVGRGEDLAPDLGRLPAGPVGELGAADAVGEAEVVLDAGALA